MNILRALNIFKKREVTIVNKNPVELKDKRGNIFAFADIDGAKAQEAISQSKSSVSRLNDAMSQLGDNDGI